jgi:hypothetical protein
LLSELLWQTSLSGSAVSAVNDVRAAARAARRAAGAKRAAEAAAQSAQKALEKQIESSAGPSEALDAAQVRHEKTRSHAMHAAIVSHETTTVKRKAAMALAHDVRQWSDHRRRELFKTCLVLSQLHRDAAHSSAGAWAVLKEAVTGPMESESKFKSEESIISRTERMSIHEESKRPAGDQQAGVNQFTGVPEVLMDDFYNTHTSKKEPTLSTTQFQAQPSLGGIGYEDPPVSETSLAGSPLISSPEGPTPAPTAPFSFPPPSDDEAPVNPMSEPSIAAPLPPPEENEYNVETALLGMGTPYSLDSEFHDFLPNQDLGSGAGGLLDDAFRQMGETPFASDGDGAPPTDAAPSYMDMCPVYTGVAPAPEDSNIQGNVLVPNVEADEATTQEDSPWDTEFEQNESSLQEQGDGGTDKDGDVLALVKSMDELDDGDEPPLQSNVIAESSINNDENPSSSTSAMQENSAAASSTADDGGGNESDAMTASMQSLVDGLMAWGNRYDPTDDIAIPACLVASILEEQEQHDQEGDDSTTKIE